MNRRTPPVQNGLHDRTKRFIAAAARERKSRMALEVAASRAATQRKKIPGKWSWSATLEKCRSPLEEFLKARHKGGSEPIRTKGA